MPLVELARASAEVPATPARLAKAAWLTECPRRLDPEEVPVAAAFPTGEPSQLGVGWAVLRE